MGVGEDDNESTGLTEAIHRGEGHWVQPVDSLAYCVSSAGVSFDVVLLVGIIRIQIHTILEVNMLRTVQITVPEPLLIRIDEAAAKLRTNRSSLARQAFEETLFRLRLAQMEQQDAEAYARQPQDPAELADWENIQDWGDV